MINAPTTPRTPYQPQAYQGPRRADPREYVGPRPANIGSGSKSSSVGGQSAVNPQARGDAFANVDKYIDQSLGNAMNRLNPALQAQKDAFDQQMVNRGISVGSDAYNKAFRQMDMNQNDARQNAAFQAMGFGTGLQNQMFQQDNARSQLANSLLQAQMQNSLGYSTLGENARQFSSGMRENARQYDNTLGENARQFSSGMREQARQFDNTLGENSRQFDDRSNMAWDNQGFGQMMGLEGLGFRDRQYNDSRSDYNNALVMSMLGMNQPHNPYYQDPTSAYNAQLGFGSSNYGSFLGPMTGFLGNYEF